MDIFTFIDNYTAGTEKVLPLFVDVKMDFRTGLPVFINKVPQMASGHEAVMGWAYRALRTVRGKSPIWTRNYGCDIEKLTGKGFSKYTTEAEAKRYITECLMVNHYISSAEVTNAVFSDDTLTVTVKIKSIYGEEDTLYV